MSEVKFIFLGVTRIKIKSRYRDVLSYKIKKGRQVFTGGMITLDRRWLCNTGIQSDLEAGSWLKVQYCLETRKYTMTNPETKSVYAIYDELINYIDSLAIENEVLNPKLELSNENTEQLCLVKY